MPFCLAVPRLVRKIGSSTRKAASFQWGYQRSCGTKQGSRQADLKGKNSNNITQSKPRTSNDSSNFEESTKQVSRVMAAMREIAKTTEQSKPEVLIVHSAHIINPCPTRRCFRGQTVHRECFQIRGSQLFRSRRRDEEYRKPRHFQQILATTKPMKTSSSQNSLLNAASANVSVVSIPQGHRSALRQLTAT
jgi:hypothetical protein